VRRAGNRATAAPLLLVDGVQHVQRAREAVWPQQSLIAGHGDHTRPRRLRYMISFRFRVSSRRSGARFPSIQGRAWLAVEYGCAVHRCCYACMSHSSEFQQFHRLRACHQLATVPCLLHSTRRPNGPFLVLIVQYLRLFTFCTLLLRPSGDDLTTCSRRNREPRIES